MTRRLLFGTILVCLIALAVFLPRLAAPYVFSRLSKHAQENGIHVSAQSFQLSWTGLKALNLQLGLMHFPLPFILSINAISIEPAWLKIFTGNIAMNLSAEAYRGSLNALAALKGQEVLIDNAELRTLDLAQMPQLAALGVRAGIVNMRVSGLVLTLERILGGQVLLEVKDLNKPGSQNWLGLAVPPLLQTGIRIKLDASPGQAVIRELHAESSWGSFHGDGFIHDLRHRPFSYSKLSVSGLIHLQNDGIRFLQGLCELGVRCPNSQWPRSFRVTLASDRSGTQIQMTEPLFQDSMQS